MIIQNIRCYVVEEALSSPPFKWRNGLQGGPGDGTPQDQMNRVAYLRMDTDEGITGAIKQARGDAIASLVLRRFKALIGKNALHTEKLWEEMWEIDRIERLQVHNSGIIDLLAWDIKSKKAQMPVYQMLGGYEPVIPAYASTVTWDTEADYERHIKICMEEGFKAFKIHAWGDLSRDAKLCERLRQWTGDDAILMYDGSAAWRLQEALKFGRILEKLNYFWYEEPMREYDLFSYQKLCSSLDLPVLAAEITEGGHWNAATWIKAEALDMVRTSTAFKGGISGAVKVSQLAEAHGMKAQVHGMGHGELQVAAAIANNDFYEQLVIDEAQIRELRYMKELPVIDGRITADNTPGLFPEPDWEWLEKTALYKV